MINVSFLDGSARPRSYRQVSNYLALGPAADSPQNLAHGDLPSLHPPGPAQVTSTGDRPPVRPGGMLTSAPVKDTTPPPPVPKPADPAGDARTAGDSDPPAPEEKPEQ
jgi:hypothetical protein